MLLSSLLRSSTFRYTVIYVAVFGLSVIGILGFVYWKAVGVIAEQTDDTIRTEIASLAEHYDQSGLIQLIQIIQERSANRFGHRGIYLLAAPDFRPLAGNLDAWPSAAAGEPGWVDFLIGTGAEHDRHLQFARARTFILPGGLRLLVGRDTTERAEFRSLITDTLLAAVALTTLLAIAGGIVISRNLLRRIDAINRGSQAILEGDMHRRMPVSGDADEFDQLAVQLNRMLDRIEQLMAGMRHVANDIAHDLRGPISRLRNRLEVTLLQPHDAETYREALAETVAETENILSTFNAILAIALAESGAVRDEFEVVDVNDLIVGVADLYAPLAEELGNAIEVDAEPGLEVHGNRHLLTQALANLVDNAVKYGGDKGPIRLAARPVSRAVEIVVSDRGPGIPKHAREAVLDRFVRLESSRSAPGSGLGLSLVAAVARLHDAALLLEDNEPGLKVMLQLPRDAA